MRIIEIRPLNNNGHTRSLKAFVDIELDNGIVIKDLRLIQEDGKRPWIACPQTSWKDPETGQVKYRTIVTFPDAMKGELDLLILNAWAREREIDRGGPDL